MIDEDCTTQLFGYTSDQLSPKSSKKIVAVCEECGMYRVGRKADYRALCGSCSQSGERNSSWNSVMMVCEVCGKEFTVKVSAVKNGRGRFCSRECQGKWMSENQCGENSPSWKGGKVAKVCEVCGKEFSVFPSQSHHKFCSRECHEKWQSESRSGENHPMFGVKGEDHPMWKEKSPRWKGGVVTRTCEVCGKEFFIPPSWLKRSGGRFCSRECHGKWQSESCRGENSPSWKGGKVAKVCEVCGGVFHVDQCDIDKRRTCSGECYGKWRSENIRGEDNPLFGKSPSIETRRRQSATHQGIPYDEWEGFAMNSPYCPKFDEACKESNREKYDRCCFLSGMTEEENGKKLSVHHVDMNKTQGCDGHAWKLVPLAAKLHSISHTPTWIARIQYLLEHVWNPGRSNVVS